MQHNSDQEKTALQSTSQLALGILSSPHQSGHRKKSPEIKIYLNVGVKKTETKKKRRKREKRGKKEKKRKKKKGKNGLK